MTQPEYQIIRKTPWRNLKYRNEVPKRVLRGDLDWTTEDDINGYFKYRGVWYHLGQFERTKIHGWDGFHGDSFFSGVLVKISHNGERFKAATLIA